MKRAFSLLVFGVMSGVMITSGCAQTASMRGRIDGLRQVATQAERNGAMRCAPRELAIAKSAPRASPRPSSIRASSRGRRRTSSIARRTRTRRTISRRPQKCAERGFVEDAAAAPAEGGRSRRRRLLDNVDKCPDEPENYQGFEDDDGCPDDPDTDGDGIADSKDSCVLLPEDKDVYLDDDGCPELDNDLDTVPRRERQGRRGQELRERSGGPGRLRGRGRLPRARQRQGHRRRLEDQCPNEPGVVGGDKPGCPKKPSLVVVTDRDQDHAADPLRVRQGQDPAGELPRARRRGGGPRARTRRSRSRSRGTPTTRAPPPTTSPSPIAAPPPCEIPRRQGRRGQPPHLEGVRHGEAAGAQHERHQPRLEPPRAVRTNRRHAVTNSASLAKNVAKRGSPAYRPVAPNCAPPLREPRLED
jgi:hypothetical protein